MRAVTYSKPLPISDETALFDLELPMPTATGRDILVEVKAVSVNPVDAIIRTNRPVESGNPSVIGWDAAGIVHSVGSEVSLFKPGDRVYYAGAINRSGSNAEYQLVDERIVGRMPENLEFAAAAALPLTTITAYEALFDRLKVGDAVPGAENAILIIGGAGGVGSIAVQIARTLTNLTVIATASRPETTKWVKDMGAHHVIDHSKPMAEQIAALGLGAPAFVFSTNKSVEHAPDIATLIAPQGRFALIDNQGSFDIMPFMSKSVSVHWEMMFTRSSYQTADMIRQHELLNEIAGLVESGKIRTTLKEVLGPINAVNLRKAHAMIETGTTKGKLVLAGF